MGEFLNNYLISLVAVVGLIVLTAMNKISADVSVPVIVTLAGVHVGSNLSSPTTGSGGQ